MIINIQRVIRGHLARRKIIPSKYIYYYYNKYLQIKGCKKISCKSTFGVALEYLYINIKKEIHIENIRKYVLDKGHILQGGTDTLQIRHLGLQYGYNIYKGGDTYKNTKIKKSNYLLNNLTEPYLSFCKNKRKENISKDIWEEIKKEYDYSCINCGSKENQPLRWNKNKKTVLQQGHMDPRQPLMSNNVIPQCSICNQQYKNKAIFNKHGFVINYNTNGF